MKMTIDEAIKELKEVRFNYNVMANNQTIVGEALNMAIASLEAWQKVLDELGDINMDIYTDEVKEIIYEHLKGVKHDD